MIAPANDIVFADTKAVRDYLLPGIWSRDDARGRELDLICNNRGGVDLKVDSKIHQLFNAEDFNDPYWLAHFNPRVIQILEDK